MEAIRDCEELVRASARAFYTDEISVVLEVLVTDKYVREDEMGPRLRMSARQARKALQQLDAERLVAREELSVPGEPLPDEEGDVDGEKKKKVANVSEVYWYIDMRRFADVIKWRVHVMRDRLAKRERAASASLAFKCGRCGARYSSLDAVKHQFRCAERLCADEPGAVLEEQRLDGALAGARALLAKVDAQLASDARLKRVGILELLKRLDGKTLPHNKPSENRASGVGGWMQAADDTRARRTKGVDSRAALGSSTFSRNALGQHISVQLDAAGAGGDGEENDEDEDDANDAPLRKVKQQPEFLQGSRVSMAPKADTRAATDEPDDDDDDDEGNARKKLKKEPTDDSGLDAAHAGGGAEAPTSTVQRGAWSTVSEPEAPTSTVQRGAWSTVSEPEAPTSTVQRGAWATVSEPPAAAPAAPAAPDEDDEDEIAWES